MVAITFETDIVSEYLRIPHFDQLKNKHVRIVIESDESTITATRHLSILEIDKNNPNFGRDEEKEKTDLNMGYDFSDLSGKLSWSGNAVTQQRALRDEW